jgi:TolB-like protein
MATERDQRVILRNRVITVRQYVYDRVQFEDLGRVPATECVFEDRSVQSGGTYFYRLAVVGAVEAKVRNPDTGQVETVAREVRGVAPVHNPLHAVVGVAESPKPLRIAVAEEHAEWTPPRNTMGQDLAGPAFVLETVRQALPKLPWVMVTMRDAPQDVAAEKTVAAMGQDDRGVATGDLLPAEACLHVGMLGSSGGTVSVWLEDYLNGRYLLMARGSIDHPDALQAQLADALAASFPERVQAHVGETAAPPDPPRVAVLPFQPAGPETTQQLSSAALRSLLVAELTAGSRFQVVDREWTDALFAEQERLALEGDEGAAELGHTLGADHLLSGTYRVVGNELVLDACLVDVARGTTSSLVSCRGQVDRLGELARQLEAKLPMPRAAADLDSAIPLRVALDLDRSLADMDYRERVETATLARSPKAEDILVAVERLEKTNPVQARTLLRRVFRRQDGSDPKALVKAARWLDRLLRPVGKAEERVGLWRRVIAEIPDPVAQQKLDVAVPFCEALCDAGKVEEAKRHILPGADALRNILLYERLGMRTQAWQQCDKEIWLDRGMIGPGYAGSVFLLQSASRQERRSALIKIARRLRTDFPWQARRAIEELARDGGLPDELAEACLQNALRFGDEKRRQEALAMLVRLPADEQVRALSRSAWYAAQSGQERAARDLMDRLEAVRTSDAKAAKMKETYLRRGVPDVKPPFLLPEFPTEEIVRRIPSPHVGEQAIGGVIYVMSNAEVVYAYDRQSQRLVWQVDLAPMVPTFLTNDVVARSGAKLGWRSRGIWANPDTVYAPACQDGRLFAIDRRTGTVRWVFTAWGPISPPVVSRDGERVAVVTALGSFRVLNARTGAVLKSITQPPLVLEAKMGRYVDLYERCDRGKHFERAWSAWATAARSEHPFFCDRNTMMLTYRGASDPRPTPFSMNLDTLACVRGAPPRAESKAALLAKLTDRRIPVLERSERIRRSLEDLPRNALFPIVMRLAQDTKEPPPVRDSAFTVMTENWPSKAVQVMAEILRTKCRQPDASCPLLKLSGEVAAGLDADAVAALVRLLDHPSLELRQVAAYDLAWALGARSLPYIRDVISLPPEKLDLGWRFDMVAAMASNRMPEGWILAAPLAKRHNAGWGGYGASGLEEWVRELARCGSLEALESLVFPFDEKSALAALREARDPLTKKQAKDLRVPQFWIQVYLPVPSFGPFLTESLRVAPASLRRGIAAAMVRVVGKSALPTYIGEVARLSRDYGSRLDRVLLRSAADFDAGDDCMAWEQELRLRASSSD